MKMISRFSDKSTVYDYIQRSKRRSDERLFFFRTNGNKEAKEKGHPPLMPFESVLKIVELQVACSN